MKHPLWFVIHIDWAIMTNIIQENTFDFTLSLVMIPNYYQP